MTFPQTKRNSFYTLMEYIIMYSKYLKRLIGKTIMVQISLGEDSIVLTNCRLNYIDKDVIHITSPDAKKTYYFNTSDIAFIGVGDFELTKKGNFNPSGYA